MHLGDEEVSHVLRSMWVIFTSAHAVHDRSGLWMNPSKIYQWIGVYWLFVLMRDQHDLNKVIEIKIATKSSQLFDIFDRMCACFFFYVWVLYSNGAGFRCRLCLKIYSYRREKAYVREWMCHNWRPHVYVHRVWWEFWILFLEAVLLNRTLLEGNVIYNGIGKWK